MFVSRPLLVGYIWVQFFYFDLSLYSFYLYRVGESYNKNIVNKKRKREE
jgi:hypothetical protein